MVEHTENVNTDNDNAGATEAIQQKRVVSGIEFPYADLETVIELAVQLQKNAGGEADDTELAAWLNQSSNGGTYRSRRSAARMFGLIEVSSSKVILTPLGRDIVDTSKSSAARSEAFLKPELYAAMYEKLKGQVLPPPSAIERMMVQLNISPKQKERARQAFMKSATHAGYIDPATSRFVKPGNASSQRPELEGRDKTNAASKSGGSGGDGGGKSGGNHLIIQGLVQALPDVGTEWEAESRVVWLKLAENAFNLIYKGGARIRIEEDG